MPALFILNVATKSAYRCATLPLQDGEGTHALVGPVRQAASYRADKGRRAAEGVACGAEAVSGRTRTRPQHHHELAEGVESRTVLMQLPHPTLDNLAAAFAQVPWVVYRVGFALKASAVCPVRDGLGVVDDAPPGLQGWGELTQKPG